MRASGDGPRRTGVDGNPVGGRSAQAKCTWQDVDIVKNVMAPSALLALLPTQSSDPILLGLHELLRSSDATSIVLSWVPARELADIYDQRTRHIAGTEGIHEQGMADFVLALRQRKGTVGLFRLGPRTHFFAGAISEDRSTLVGVCLVDSELSSPDEVDGHRPHASD